MRDLRRELRRKIQRVDQELSRIARLNNADRTLQLDTWLDRRLRLMLRRDQLETLGFTVTDRRRIR
ncbi:MAG TPA: hypothetical protein VE476_10635 [Propionibacteriaceae bacterium]|jgi:hypothetical protein|nr:hypothetical protein [Propionibacteriaceae bacterium]